MAILLRILAVPVLIFLLRQARERTPPVVHDMEKLPWNQKLDLAWRLVRDDRMPIFIKPVVLIPAVYMASPIDVLPDFIPIIGRLDDAFIFSTTYAIVSGFVPSYVLQEHFDAVSR
jgi:uncharacterized membrane protein YkvA (DUF1232 family)